MKTPKLTYYNSGDFGLEKGPFRVSLPVLFRTPDGKFAVLHYPKDERGCGCTPFVKYNARRKCYVDIDEFYVNEGDYYTHPAIRQALKLIVKAEKRR